MPRVGKIIITNTTIPSPPIQCVKLRQNKTEYGRDSTSENIEAPVVVNPDAVSKNASTNESIDPLSRNGNVPMHDRTSHESETARNPSLLRTFSAAAFFDIIYKPTDTETAIRDDQRKGSGDSL